MRVLITGATGFIGSHLAELLHANGHQVRCLIRKTSNLRWIRHLPNEYVEGDLFNPEAMKEAVAGVDRVYHLAGITKARTKEEYYRGNHHATRNLLESVLKHRPDLGRFVHVSSQAAVGPSMPGAPVDEATPFHPITTYGRSKMEAEKECLRVADRLPVTIVRPPAVYGPRDRDVFEFFNTMSRGLHPLIGFGEKVVSLIHVRDLVGGIVLAGGHPAAVGQTYFISSKVQYNWRQVGELTAGIMGKHVIRLRIPEWGVYAVAAISEAFSAISRRAVLLNMEKAKDLVQDAWTCSIGKAERELGYQEKLTLAEGIRDTVDWYRREGWLR